MLYYKYPTNSESNDKDSSADSEQSKHETSPDEHDDDLFDAAFAWMNIYK